MTVAHINIGSNLGHSAAIIGRAVAGIRSINGTSVIGVSSLYASPPWGYVSENRYVNAGVMVSTALSPGELLSRLRRVECSIDPSPHRLADGTYADRTVDIDLIDYGNMVAGTDGAPLMLPHPRAHLRDFVLRPIAELDPGWRHPLSRLTATQLLAKLPDHLHQCEKIANIAD